MSRKFQPGPFDGEIVGCLYFIWGMISQSLWLGSFNYGT
jgi:hypothetical protein